MLGPSGSSSSVGQIQIVSSPWGFLLLGFCAVCGLLTPPSQPPAFCWRFLSSLFGVEPPPPGWTPFEAFCRSQPKTPFFCDVNVIIYASDQWLFDHCSAADWTSFQAPSFLLLHSATRRSKVTRCPHPPFFLRVFSDLTPSRVFHPPVAVF